MLARIIMDIQDKDLTKQENIGQIVYFGILAETKGIHGVDNLDLIPLFQGMLRSVYTHMRGLPLTDIASSLRYLSLLQDEKKIMKFIRKLQN